jgi:hypothetical protein
MQQAESYGIIDASHNAAVLNCYFAVLADFDLYINMISKRFEGELRLLSFHLNNIAVKLCARGDPLLKKGIAAVVGNKGPAKSIRMQ